MAFPRPTLSQIRDRILGDLQYRLEGADTQLRRAFLFVLATVMAGAINLLYGFIEWVYEQMFPGKADKEHRALWLDIFGIPPTIATFSSGGVDIKGTNGSILAKDTLLQRGDGVQYKATADATIAGGVAVAQVQALVAGSDGNAVAGTKLTLVSPVAGIESSASVAAGDLTGGVDEEGKASQLDRLYDRLRRPPRGGGPGDYKKWAREISGVTRAWESSLHFGLGTVALFFVRDDDGDGAAIIPDAGELAAVKAHILTTAPIDMKLFNTVAPVAEVVNFDITLNDYDSANYTESQVKANIESSLKTLFKKAEPRIDNISQTGTIPITQVSEAISRAAGETDHTLNSPSANLTPTVDGGLKVFGAINWS